MPTTIEAGDVTDVFKLNGKEYPRVFLATFRKENDRGQKPVKLFSVEHPSIQTPLIQDLYDTTIDGTAFSFNYGSLSNNKRLLDSSILSVDPLVLDDSGLSPSSRIMAKDPFYLLTSVDDGIANDLASVDDFKKGDRFILRGQSSLQIRVVKATEAVTYYHSSTPNTLISAFKVFIHQPITDQMLADSAINPQQHGLQFNLWNRSSDLKTARNNIQQLIC